MATFHMFGSGRWMRQCWAMEKHWRLYMRQRRFISMQDARSILDVDQASVLTPRVLRTAYLEAAKKCHPDTQMQSKEVAGEQFRRVTEAYELLLRMNTNNHFTNDDFGITEDEEMEYRVACREKLGLDAEVVEESKKCLAFRQWLQGRTDAAHYWKSFFMRYGGLAPKLRRSLAGMIEGSKVSQLKSSSRRRRPSSS